MHTNIHMYVQCLHIYTYIHIYIYLCTYMHTYIHTDRQILVRTNIIIFTYIHTHLRTYIHMYIREYIQAYITHIHTHTYIMHACIPTHTYKYIYTYNTFHKCIIVSQTIECGKVVNAHNIQNICNAKYRNIL